MAVWKSVKFGPALKLIILFFFPIAVNSPILIGIAKTLSPAKAVKKQFVLLQAYHQPRQILNERILNLARGHWGIENKSHYVRDVTFDEDRSQISKKSGPRVMATLRNFVISILRLIGRKNIAKALRDMAAKPHMALRLIGI